MKIQNSFWVLVNPDNGHWDDNDVREAISRLAETWSVEVLPSDRRRDGGFGQEAEFVVVGEEEDILSFLSELNECLY